MPAGQYTLLIEESAKLARTFIWRDDAGVPIDLTGCTASIVAKFTDGTDIIPATDLAIDALNGKIMVDIDIGALPHSSMQANWRLTVSSAALGDCPILCGDVAFRYAP
jgi:hypothetical protein